MNQLTPEENITATLGHLARALKTPTIGRVWQQLGDTAREQGWTHEQYLAAVLQRQVADREANGTAMRLNSARFPARKTLEDFNLDYQPSLRRDVLAHLATTNFIPLPTTSACWAHSESARPIWPSGWASKPANPATRCCLTPPPAG